MREFSAVEFVVPGKPIGKGRPRIGKVGAHARMFTPKETVAYEGLIAHAAQIAMAGRDLIPHPVMVELEILLPIPQSKSKKWKAQAVAGQVFPTTKPDMDNVIKAIYDGLNGVVWRDDVQVVDAIVRKRYAETPCVRVRIVPLMTEEAA